MEILYTNCAGLDVHKKTEGCIILVVCPPCLETDELLYFLSKETHFFDLSPVSPLTAQLNNLVARLVGTVYPKREDYTNDIPITSCLS
jgi:hypothetical protein